MASQYRRRTLMLNTIPKVAQGNPTIITDSSSRRLQKLNIYGQSSQDGTPSVENPIPINSKEISKIKVTGVNLFDFVTLAGGEGATFEKNGLSARIENGYLITTGTAINDAFTNIIFISVPPEKSTIFKPGTYTIGKGDKNVSVLTIGISAVGDTERINKRNTFTINEPFVIRYFYIAYALGQNANGEKCPLIMTYGSEPLYEYEPYIEPQIVNLTSPITLRGIPVASNGNVTIGGQQYVSDVITEKDGVIGTERNDGFIENYTNENVGDIYISTTGELSQGASVLYPLSEPTFEPLPEDIQTQYKALKSYYPNTVIQTGCWNEVTYSAKRGG